MKARTVAVVTSWILSDGHAAGNWHGLVGLGYRAGEYPAAKHEQSGQKQSGGESKFGDVCRR